MFAKQTITKDPVSVQPTVFDIYVILGFYSYPVILTVEPNNPILDSTAWHTAVTLSITPSTQELLLIPWIADAVGEVSANNPELTDSLLLGDVNIDISIALSGFGTDLPSLAPSWYVREPFKTEFNLPCGTQDHLDPTIVSDYTDAANKDAKEHEILWEEMASKDKVIDSLWDFLTPIDVEISSGYQEFLDKLSIIISQKYSYPEIKDSEKSINWGEFIDKFITDIKYKYSYPDWKDLEKTLPWDLFTQEINKELGLKYSHPPALDVFKTIFVGPNWFPKWCIGRFEKAYGELVFNFVTATDLPYNQYFPSTEYLLNEKEEVSRPSQLERLPSLFDYKSSYPSGGTFGGRPIARKAMDKIELRGGTGGNLKVDTGFLEYPIYMRDSIDNYSLICFDGYRTGPQDKYDYRPVYYKVIIPNIRSYYFVMNTVTLKRVSDNVPIPIIDMSISTDMDSWCWGFQASLRRSVDLDLVRPSGGAPVEVEASINGNVWRFIIESYGDSRSFGKKEYTITGRSPSSLLAGPYVASESFIEGSQRQAVQLAEDALVNSGFTANWELTDWLVPANAYSVIDKTTMQQLLGIAQSVGGVVHSDMASTTISLLPWYSSMPWEWGGAIVDAVLPTFSSRSTQYEAKPQYSGVYVSGQTQGVLCLIKRTGTDGSAQPQMVTDPLITATEAGIQRGKRILADSGRRSVESIDAPLLDDPGLLTPGMLIDVIDSSETWRGQVIRTSISARRPTVTQSLSILRYHGT